MLKVRVGTVKESTAAIASRWLRRNVSQRWLGSAILGARRIQRETLRSEISKPSMRSSPWIRGARQVGFSATILKISSRISFGTALLPIGFRTHERNRQYT